MLDASLNSNYGSDVLTNEKRRRNPMAVITISRQFGAGGKTLAQKVADKLGYKIAHEEIIEQLTEKANVSEKGLHAFEAEGEGLIDKSTGMLVPKRFLDHLFEPSRKYMDGKRYAELLREIVPKIADKDNIVFLGRGTQFVLKDRKNTHHVLLVADKNRRISFMQENYGLSLSETESVLERQTKRRIKLLKLFHPDNFDQPYHYNLVLNMSKIDMDQAVHLVCKMASSA
jgi:cytidylate kinase